MMKPFWYEPSGAVVRKNVTVQGVTEPGAAVNDVADGVTLRPPRPVYENVYVSDTLPTLVADRGTVCEPAMSPIAIDAWFRSLASSFGIDGMDEQQRPWPFRNASQSFRLLSKTRPGSTALFGSTWPAPQANGS